MIPKIPHPPPSLEDFTCPICHYQGPAQVRYDFAIQKIHACPFCRLLFLHPQPGPGELGEIYSGEDYFANQAFYDGDNRHLYGYADYFAERMNKQAEYRKIAEKCMEWLRERETGLREPPRLLDVGCGPGYFLEEAARAGFAVEGIEFNTSIVKRARERYPFPISRQDYILDPHQGETYDCITMFDVLEHFRDPFRAVDKAFASLSPGGLLVVSTVDSGSLVSRALGKRLEDFRRVREHLFFFNRRNLAQQLRRSGFYVCDVTSIGHTFLVGHLLARLRLMFPVRARLPRAAAGLLEKAAGRSVTVNPRTKMIVYAKRPSDAYTEWITGNIRRDLAFMQGYEDYYHCLIRPAREFIRGRRVMEIGCGTGSAMNSLLFHGARTVVGVDRDPAVLETARSFLEKSGRSRDARFALADAEASPDLIRDLMGREKTEVVFTFNFLEHLLDDMRFIRSIHECLAPGGLFINVIPAGGFLYNRMDAAYHHVRRYDAHDIDLRFASFECLGKHRLGLLRGLGWLLAGRKAYRGLKGPLKMYKFFFGLDRMVDAALGRRVPLGATWVCVHRKN